MKVAPSLLAANFLNLYHDMQTIIDADYIHLDIMDGHFVPNISYGLSITDALTNLGDFHYDVHLMILEPHKYIKDFARCNPDFITFHVEANTNVLETIKLIKSLGIKAGISLKPSTAFYDIEEYLEFVDLVLIMTVEPGFGGQSFMHNQVEKIKRLAQLKVENNYRYIIEVDGGINEHTVLLVKEAGCEMVVAGSYIFQAKDRKKAIKSLR